MMPALQATLSWPVSPVPPPQAWGYVPTTWGCSHPGRSGLPGLAQTHSPHTCPAGLPGPPRGLSTARATKRPTCRASAWRQPSHLGFATSVKRMLNGPAPRVPQGPACPRLPCPRPRFTGLSDAQLLVGGYRGRLRLRPDRGGREAARCLPSSRPTRWPTGDQTYCPAAAPCHSPPAPPRAIRAALCPLPSPVCPPDPMVSSRADDRHGPPSRPPPPSTGV